MSKVTCDTTITLDGFTTGVNQSLEHPFGDNVDEDRLHGWMFKDAEANQRAIEKITAAGAYIMGRNMFSPGRGDWDLDWKGWWGDDPPYHAPVFVLTHYPREPLEMKGGTTYHFVTDGIESALAQAREAAGDGNVSIAGGAHTVSQYLAAGLIDELRLHIVPLIIGAGERPLDGVGDLQLEQVESWATDLVTHITYRTVR
jgi:dihydrofolate reductase